MKHKSKLSLIAAIFAFVALFVVRLLLLAGGTDKRTGFLYDENGFLINFSYYGLLIITAIAMLVLGIFDRKNKNGFYTNDISQFIGTKAVLLGFPLLMAGAMIMYEGYMQTRSVTPSAYLIFVNFVFGAAIVILSLVILYKQEIKPALGFSLVVPAVYYTLRGIGIFLERMAVVTIPEYLIECLSFIGFAIFFMQLAKLMTGNETITTRFIISVSGITTSLMVLSSAIATIVTDIFFPDSMRIFAHATVAEFEHQKLCSQYSFDNYCMAYTSWADVLIAVCLLLTVIALHMGASKAVEETAETEA